MGMAGKDRVVSRTETIEWAYSGSRNSMFPKLLPAFRKMLEYTGAQVE